MTITALEGHKLLMLQAAEAATAAAMRRMPVVDAP
jgi:hypothetical protein